MREKSIIFVVGMLQGGIPTLSALLHAMGADFGKNTMASNDHLHVTGTREHQSTTLINNGLLAELDREWYDLEELPEHWQRKKSLAGFRTRIRDLVESAFGSHFIGALEHPGFCHLLPVWIDALRGDDHTLKAALIVHEPEQVVDALCNEYPFDQTTAYLLWAIHFRDAEINTRKLERTILNYPDLLQNQEAAALQISRDLHLEKLSTTSAFSSIAAQSLADIQKRQTATRPTPTGEVAQLCTHIYETYQEQRFNPDSNKFDPLWKELNYFLLDSAQMIGALSRCTRKLVGHLSLQREMENALSATRTELQNRETSLNETRRQLEHVRIEHRQALGTISGNDSRMKMLGQQLEQLEREHNSTLTSLRERETELQTLQVSHSGIEQDAESARNALAQAEQKILKMDQDLKKLREDRRCSEDELATHDRQIANLTGKQQGFTDQLASLEEMKLRLAEYEAMLTHRVSRKLKHMLGRH